MRQALGIPAHCMRDPLRLPGQGRRRSRDSILAKGGSVMWGQNRNSRTRCAIGNAANGEKNGPNAMMTATGNRMNMCTKMNSAPNTLEVRSLVVKDCVCGSDTGFTGYLA